MTIAFDAIEAAVIDRLLALPTVTNIAGTRIRSGITFATDAFPRVSVECESIAADDEDLTGYGGTTLSTILVTCYARDYHDARKLEYATRHGRIDNAGASAGLLDFDRTTIDSQTIETTNWRGTTYELIEIEGGEAAPIYAFIGRYEIRAREPQRA